MQSRQTWQRAIDTARRALRPAPDRVDTPTPARGSVPPRARRDLIDLFVERARHSGVGIERVTEDEVAAELVRLLGDRAVDAAADVGWTVAGQGPEAAGAVCCRGAVAVLERATLGVATAGTLVVTRARSDGADPRAWDPLARHVCLLHESRVVVGVPEAVAMLDPRGAHRWLRGTAAEPDLELERVGVHDEPDLHVVLIG